MLSHFTGKQAVMDRVTNGREKKMAKAYMMGHLHPFIHLIRPVS